MVLIRQGLRHEAAADVLALAERRGVAVRTVDRAELDALAHGGTHGGIAAICSARPLLSAGWLVDHVRRLREPALLLLLEGIEDARNLGFTLRTAEAMGAHAVLIKKHLWDLDATEIARPASGAYERLALVRVESVDVVRELRKAGVHVVGCLARARRSIRQVDLRRATLLAVGGEKRGLSGAMRGQCDAFATIPTVGGASSLSLSHAAAIALAEVLRQRTEE